ncbi:MAG: 4-diphosphocytidyl-2-C-methyl-D-erythritol kinase [Alphaproteobacteria bacterium]|nr:MAG: 4-diphosphocytidyl-2-C-methyl-D-erythritol kinase [Alphaproteobacteria bacterium]
MHSDYIEEFAFAKLNLSFKVLKKLPNNFHQIESYITFLPNIYDHLIIKKSLQNKIVINGKFANQLIANGGDTLIKKSIKLLSNLLNLKVCLEVNLKKNIPLNSGLGGGSADAAAIIRAIIKLYKIKNNKLIINNLSKIGSDVPACFLSKNVKVSGTGEILQPIKLLNKKLWALLIKPKSNYSTKNIFENFNNSYAKPTKFELTLNNLINDMNKYNNSLEKTVCRIEKNVKNVLSYLYNFNSLTLPRITGSGSTVFVLFKTEQDLKIYKKKLSFSKKDYWIQYSHLIL